MGEKILLRNGTVWTGGEEPLVVEDGALLVADGRVEALYERAKLDAAELGDVRVLDARGGLVVPGFVNLHHHFYSALARGLDPGRPTSGFGEVLDSLWWRLDRALDAETVRLSAQLVLLECIRHGCTTVFDHHSSPSAMAGSLDLVGEAVLEAGLRAALSYEVTDRNGHDAALAGIDENARFAASLTGEKRLRGIMGLHASFTLSNETLRAAAEHDLGCHVHVAEDPIDVEESQSSFGCGPVQRLDAAGLLGERSLLAHCVHLDEDSLELVSERGSVLVHNPESNLHNGVGWLDLDPVAEHGILVGLGTDGMGSSMLRSLRASFLGERGVRRDPTRGFSIHPGLLASTALAARRFFDEPLLGEIAVGAPADVAVLDAPSPTPVGAQNVFGHLVHGASEASVRHTIANGEILLEDFEPTGLDPEALADHARRVSPALWKRFQEEGFGTPFRRE